MPDKDKLFEELIKGVSKPAIEFNEEEKESASLSLPILNQAKVYESESDTEILPNAEHDEYSVVLSNAQHATVEFEQALARSKSRKSALAKLPFPWVQPVLRTLLWGSGMAVAFYVVRNLYQREVSAGFMPDWAQSDTLIPIVFIALGLVAGENLGLGMRGLFSSRRIGDRFQYCVSMLLFAGLLIINFLVLNNVSLSHFPDWFNGAVFCISLIAALSLPWFGTSRREYNRLLKSIDLATRRQNDAHRKARRAVDKLSELHAAHLRPIPKRFKRRQGWRF